MPISGALMNLHSFRVTTDPDLVDAFETGENMTISFADFAASTGIDFQDPAVRAYYVSCVPRMSSCYETWRRDHSAKPEPIDVAVVVGRGGKIASAKATSRDSELATCIRGVAKTVAFTAPGSGNGLEMSYQVRFAVQRFFYVRPRK